MHANENVISAARNSNAPIECRKAGLAHGPRGGPSAVPLFGQAVEVPVEFPPHECDQTRKNERWASDGYVDKLARRSWAIAAMSPNVRRRRSGQSLGPTKMEPIRPAGIAR